MILIMRTVVLCDSWQARTILQVFHGWCVASIRNLKAFLFWQTFHSTWTSCIQIKDNLKGNYVGEIEEFSNEFCVDESVPN
jgi:hypothetical protein